MPVPLTVAAAASAVPALPVVLLVVGLVVLAVGLVLLTGGRERAPVRPEVRRPVRSTPAAPREAPCDWSAWLEDEDGGRTLLRAAEGRPCCTYVLRVRDLDPVDAPLDEVDEALVWHGAATRLGHGVATTPLERDVVTRRATTGAGSATTVLSLDRSVGDEVMTATPTVDEAVELWRRHLDDLHDRGARPVPTDGSRVAPLVRRRRVEAILAVERACEVAAHPAVAEVQARAWLAGAREGTARPVAGLLASWVQVGTTTVVADRPTAEPVGVDGWHPTSEPPATGLAVTGDPGAGTCEGEWSATRSLPVEVDRLAVVVGTATRVELELDDAGSSPVAVEVQATTSAGVHVRTGAPSGAGCTRCLPELELAVGRPAAPDVRSADPGSTHGAVIRLDGRSTQLRPPVPGSGTRSWTAAPEDVPSRGAQPATAVR